MATRSLTKLSVNQLHRKIRTAKRRAERKIAALEQRRDRMAKKVHALEIEISALSKQFGRPMGSMRRRRYARNESTLADSLVKVLTGVTMSVTEVAKAVQKAGYKTTSPNFRVMVNQTLIKDKRIKRVGRGRYTGR